MTPGQRSKNFRRERARVLKERTRILRTTRAQVAGTLRETLKRIREVLAAQPTDFQQWRLPQLEREVRQVLAELEGEAARAMRAGAGRAWEAGQALATEPLEAAGIRISAVLPQIDPRQLNAISSFMVSRMRDITEQTANRIMQELGIVVIGGQSPSEAIAAIARRLDNRSRATTVVRTEVGRVFSVASQERKRQAAEVVPGLQKQWRRSGKIHSRLHHDSIDGQIRDVDKPFTLGNGVEIMFPRDPAAPAKETINCGCQSVPHMESWDVFQPGRQPFSEREMALDPRKRELARLGFDRAA